MNERYWVYQYPSYTSYSKAWMECSVHYYNFAKQVGVLVAKGK